VIEACAVALRGWDYPHVDRSDRANGTDWIASWCEFAGHREYWRFFQSAQFVHLFSFREDAIRNSLEAAIEKTLVGVPPGAEPPTGCADVGEMLFNITEVYEFASRLVQRMALEGSVSISIELVDVRSRILTALEFSRAWWGYYPAVESNLAHTVTIPIDRIVASASDLALDEAVWFFHRFQWNEPNRTVLQNDQRKLLSRGL